MNGRVLVVLASRDRPFALLRMVDSVLKTSPLADIAVYVDEDQRKDYEIELPPNTRLHFGPRLGPVASLNDLVRRSPGYEAYGAATDDCLFATVGWDRWVLETARSFKGGIGVMGPWLDGALRKMDFPWATANWINTLGFFAHPQAHHFYWDVMLEMLGEATQMKNATQKEFEIKHDGHPSSNLEKHLLTDSFNFARWCAFDRRDQIQRLRSAIG